MPKYYTNYSHKYNQLINSIYKLNIYLLVKLGGAYIIYNSKGMEKEKENKSLEALGQKEERETGESKMTTVSQFAHFIYLGSCFFTSYFNCQVLFLPNPIFNLPRKKIKINSQHVALLEEELVI